MQGEFFDEAKRSLVDSKCAHIAQDRTVLAIFLVGSYSRGAASKDSDIDLAVIHTAGSETHEHIHTDHGTVGIETFGERQFAYIRAMPLLDPKQLREAGRFAEGCVQFTRWPSLQDAQYAWRRALLAPEFAIQTLSLIDSQIKFANADRLDEPLRLWALQSATDALTKFALNLTSIRYQKPKWVVRDLTNVNNRPLLDALKSTFGFACNSPELAARAVRLTRRCLIRACDLVGLPRLEKSATASFEYAYIRRTLRDAESLLRDGDLEGCIYTSAISLRLMASLIVNKRHVTPGKPISKEAAMSWWIGSVREATPEFHPCRLATHSLLESCATIAAEVEACYRNRYAALTAAH